MAQRSFAGNGEFKSFGKPRLLAAMKRTKRPTHEKHENL